MSVLPRHPPVDMSVLPSSSPVDMSAFPRNSLVIAPDKTGDEGDGDDEEGLPTYKIKLSELRSHLDDLITFIG
jgi:hypothetical protein